MNRTPPKFSCTRVVATCAAFVVLGGGTAAMALGGMAGEPSATIAKKKGDRRVGSYRGTTEEGGTVSFRITKKRQVVGFEMPNVPYECVVQQQGTGEPRYSKPPVTIKAPPMKLRGVAKFAYQDLGDDSGPDLGFFVDGKPDPAAAPGRGQNTALKGNGGMFSWNGPAYDVGTEYCATEYVDWSADKVGKK